MPTTTSEKRGEVILGTHLVHCHHDTRFDVRGILRLVGSPLLAGEGGIVHWTKEETKPGGWHRKVPMEITTAASDPSRATSRFEVVSVKKVPPSDPGFFGRDAGYGGGTEIIVRRIDGKGERIRYTRACCFNTDVCEPATLVTP
jgi:hypothetical protein